MNRIVVTGALGYIGSALIREIPRLYPDAEVWMVDNMQAQRYGSLFDLPENGKYRFFEEDIREADWRNLLEEADVVVHLAAITDQTNSFQFAEEVESVNVGGTEIVAEACTKSGTKLIYLSTTSVYGKSYDCADEDCPLEGQRPQSPYAESKIRTENLINEIGRKEGLRYAICRFGTVFGVSPGIRFNTVVNKFCWQAVKGESLTVWKTALEQVRPYLHITDGARIIRLIIEKNLFDNQIYNGVTLNTTPQAVISAISQFVPNVQCQLVDSQIMNQLSYNVTGRKISDLGFDYRGDLKEGIRETIQLLQQAQSAYPASIAFST